MMPSDTISMPPPPPAETPPPLPSSVPLPSYSMPELPPRLKLDVKPQALLQLRQEEKLVLWQERTKVIAESVLAYEAFQILEEEYEKAVKVTETRFFTTLPSADRKRLTAQVDALLLQRNTAYKKYEDIQDRLPHSSWPITPGAQSSLEGREKHQALVNDVNQLQDTAFRVQTALQDIRELSKPPPQLSLFLPGDGSDEDGENQLPHTKWVMDVNQSSASTANDIRPPRPTKDTPAQEEIQAYRDKLVMCQEQLENLWNHCHQHDNGQHQDFERELQDRIEMFQQKRAKEQQDRENRKEKQAAAKEGAIKDIDQRASFDGKDLATITADITNMLLTVEQLQAELQKETQARHQSFQRMLQVEQRLSSYTAAQQANTTSLESLQAALNAYTTQPPSSSISPKVPAPSYLIATLEQPLISSLRVTIRPVLEDLRGDVEQLVKEKNGQLFATVWKKISQTLGVLNLIHKRLDAARLASQSEVQ